MWRRIILPAILALALAGVVGASDLARSDIDEHRSCAHCGMDRKAYGYSRMLIVYEDGGQTGVCSLHCAVTELDTSTGRTIKVLLVADRESRVLIPAEQAVWVMGGKKRGVMTQRPKWAFSQPMAAQSFVAVNGGSLVSWTEALATARAEVSR